MISPARFVDDLLGAGVEFFAGVPDSLLKALSAEIDSRFPKDAHVIAANEGAAVGMAIGHHLRTGKVAVVYLQNSGVGNAVNPLLSLADPEVYGIPMVLVVGWRGAPGSKDEPQHVKQGRVMQSLLDAMELPSTVLPVDEAGARECAAAAVREAAERSGPVVILVESGTFEAGDTPARAASDYPTREEALVCLVSCLPPDAIAVATTGMLGRELFEHDERSGGGERHFLTVGGMGHASAIALGIALASPSDDVWCLDGDGALLMHLGTVATIGERAPENLFHVVFNNAVHDSVGGQPTSISAVDVPALALAAGYRSASTCGDVTSLQAAAQRMQQARGPALLEVKLRVGSRPDLGRPTRTPRENKERFMAATLDA